MTKFVPVPADRARIDAIAGGSEVVLPARRQVLLIVFLPLWLCGWAFGVRSAISTLRSPKATDQIAFMSVWLALWLAGGLFAIGVWLWHVGGREHLRVTRDAIVLRREVLGIGFGKRYDPTQVRHLRALDAPLGNTSRNPFGGDANASLAFDYGAQTIRFGAGIDHAEARHVVERIIATAGWLEVRP